MKHEITENKIIISETDINFETIYQKSWFPIEEAQEIKQANFLIVPTDFLSDSKDVLFPETTSAFFEFVQSQNDNELVCDIAIAEDNFRKIEKHSALIEVATILVKDVFLPVVLSLIANFLYDLVKKHRRTPEQTSARVKILSEESKAKKTLQIEYEGPVAGIEESLANAVNEYFKNEK